MIKPRLTKAASAPAADTKTKQLFEDPFATVEGYGETIVQPPYSLENLVYLAESHPLHAAALEQKAIDVVGSGPKFVPLHDEANETQRAEIERWFEELSHEHTLVELLQAVWLDYETVGWGFIEIARDAQGIVRRLYPIPAHTMRAHRDSLRYVQIRQGRRAWFKRWGAEWHDFGGKTSDQIHVNVNDGSISETPLPPEDSANEVLVFVKPSRRSSWYGIPTYIASLGYIVLSLAARDYNIKFFSNSREPRFAVLISKLSPDAGEEFVDELQRALQISHAEPHRNIIIPTTGETEVRFERLTAVQNDMHFTKLLEQADRNILVAHRIPPDRLGAVARGFLGGNVAANINRIYKSAVVDPAQAILEHRLNRFIRTEFSRAAGIDPKNIAWRVQFERLDISDETEATERITEQVKQNIITLNEARVALGYPSADEAFDVTLAAYLQRFGGMAKEASQDQDSFKRKILERLDAIDSLINDLMETPPEESLEWGAPAE